MVASQAFGIGNQTLNDRLYDYAAKDVQQTQVGTNSDAIVVFVDNLGSAILPDLESFQDLQTSSVKPTLISFPTYELTFTFNSSSYPWSAAEIEVLNGWLGNFYPAVKSLCGNPFFDNTVNVRKDPTISFAGEYNPTINETVVQDANSPDVLCHELIHALRDDYLMGLMSFEEGMTRACEVEVMSRFPGYAYLNKNHSYEYDVFYEGMNRPEIGSQDGNFFYGYVSPFLRYQLAGYAWAKCFLENTNFFQQFNCELRTRNLADPTTCYTESKLIAIATDILPTVEGRGFLTWYAQQGVLNTSPPKGYFLFQRIFDAYTVVDYCFRDSSGVETAQANAPIQWTVLDNHNGVLDNGSDTTSPYGTVVAIPFALGSTNYSGRIRVLAQTSLTNSLLLNTTFRATGPFWTPLSGIFGVVSGFDAGTVTITPLSTTNAAVVVDVVNGSFAAPSLQTNRGRFLAELRTRTGAKFSKQFNKDASSYYLVWCNSTGFTMVHFF